MTKHKAYPQLSITQDRHCWITQISTSRNGKAVARDTYYMEANLVVADTEFLTYDFTITRYRSTRWTGLNRLLNRPKVVHSIRVTITAPASTSPDPDRETADRLHRVSDEWFVKNNI